MAIVRVINLTAGEFLVTRAKQLLDAGLVVEHREIKLFSGNEKLFQILFDKTFVEHIGLPVVRNDGVTSEILFHQEESVAFVVSLMSKEWNMIRVDLLSVENATAEERLILFANQLREHGGRRGLEQYRTTNYAHPRNQAGLFLVNENFIERRHNAPVNN
ncbi:hypothetical protein CRE_29228 [Caenorhabditis remanei]|uniref:Uncharacterized protein n=1 Tax=Caenorhabditis remanei TaxID=31234 RepID=E3NKI1_CAERE|nr:hypothetical protein CRE_29228 [Caenorhabditis remanei]